MIDVSPSKQTYMALLLLVCLFAIVRSLMRKSADQDDEFSFMDFIMERDPITGKRTPSVLRSAYIGAFVFSIWLMVYLALADKMTEGYFTIFNGSWVLPLTAYMIWGKKIPLELLQKLGAPSPKDQP